jgi:hypothetical protein
LRIVIETIPHADQRYPTTGDWFIGYDETSGRPEQINIKVSDMGNWKYEALVGIHEAVEAVLCLAGGVSPGAIDAFDIAFEAQRPVNCERKDPQIEALKAFMEKYGADVVATNNCEEPGDHPQAPYGRQHGFATAVERMVCAELGIAWYDYDRANIELY